MKLTSHVTEIKGVGSEVGKKFESLGVETIYDLIDCLPRRYDDFSRILPISKIKPGRVTIRAEIKQARGRYARRSLHITEAVASDETGSVRLVWFNQPYRAKALKAAEEYFISGEFQLSYQKLSIMNPSTELVSAFPVSTARIIPIYRETKGLKSNQIRRIVREVIQLVRNLEETLPAWLIKQGKLERRNHAYEMLHFPSSVEELEKARHRFGFEEVFRLSLASLLNKYELLSEKSVAVKFDEKLAREFVAGLPFQLTDAQRKAVWRIFQDMERTRPMNRLLEGDVGSGKTVVAAMASAMAIKQGFQVALMAPTELLARQHAETIHKLLDPLGMQDKVGLLVGGLKADQKKRAQEHAKGGDTGILIGTHALIQEKVDLNNLGLVIIDEQHRFGVKQREALQAKAGHMPHVLTMTATPIPRSLALTLYGELDISIIDVKPRGRKQIITKIVSPNSRAQLYSKVKRELDKKRQMFVVCPAITESEVLPVKSAEEVYETLKKKEFKGYKLGLLHGKMKVEDKEKVMGDFAAGKLDILVATTVIEVGVDVPNAAVMLVENAERFGLAQIHQLRGRVGRSEQQGYCYLMMGDSSEPSRRLKALEAYSDGFKLAELDLEIRGPGAIYGRMQHGQFDLRVAELSDTKLIAGAREAAQEFIDRNEDLLKYKELNEHVGRLRAVTNLN